MTVTGAHQRQVGEVFLGSSFQRRGDRGMVERMAVNLQTGI